VSYKPRPVDLAWAKNALSIIKDGGTLAYPETQMIYRVDHSNKQLVLQNPEQLMVFASFVIHQQSIAVFKALDYEVKETTGPWS
jgi:hypothetical protein